LAFFLAIDKLFAARRRPVLQFIMIDQVTRPYFPDDRFSQIVELPAPEGQDAAPAGADDAPQIIICEKANAQVPIYQGAIVLLGVPGWHGAGRLAGARIGGAVCLPWALKLAAQTARRSRGPGERGWHA
jgi:hypothetical protein